MGWEYRPSGEYYTRSVRLDGNVQRLYFGNGPAGQLAATLDEQHRELDRQRRAAHARLEAGLEKLQQLFVQLVDDVNRLEDYPWTEQGFTAP